MTDPLRIHLSLVSHTNIGKTTLARTLLMRDVGEIADRAHVTETTDDYVLARAIDGSELVLWDTPGFGNSVQLAKRLEGRANPLGWFLSEVWDRFTNKAFGSISAPFGTFAIPPASCSISSMLRKCRRAHPMFRRK